jgi:hypothetical protein
MSTKCTVYWLQPKMGMFPHAFLWLLSGFFYGDERGLCPFSLSMGARVGETNITGGSYASE